jgi:limonene-1,2-epoxide hydrolase
MADTPDSLVRAFIAALSARDIDTAETMVSADFEYDNVPVGKAFGPTGLRSTLTGFFGMLEDVDWEIVRQTSTGTLARGTVLNERDDRVRIGGEWRSLPVAGVFEVIDGRITLWRDYFDRPTLMALMGAGGN